MCRPDNLSMESIRYLKGVGPKKEALFNRLGVNTLRDLVYYFPLRYEDRRHVALVRDLKENESFLVRGRVLVRNLKQLKFNPWRSAKGKNSLFEAVIEDKTAKANCVWFNQGYLADYIKVGDEILVYGKVRTYKGQLQFVSPEFEVLSGGEDSRLSVGRIVGFYSLTRGLTQKTLRKTVYAGLQSTLKDSKEPLPYQIRKKINLPNTAQALRDIHFPSRFEAAAAARKRFIFEELFLSQVRVYLRKARQRFQKGAKLAPGHDLIDRVKANLSFELTPSQEKAVEEITADLEKPYPMHRLLQGEVGSGKTLVAACAIGVTAKAGYQAALMVPTEVLAFQHFQTLKSLFKSLGFKIQILVSSLPEKKKQSVQQDLKAAKVDIVVGTHSLVEEMVEFKNLGLAVIDEQHKFGVAQRALLPKKGKEFVPHCLVMSATPIPRSLALSLYGDLDLSILRELPPGRKLPRTIAVKESKRSWVYDLVKTQLKEGRQAYIIYPLIEESAIWDLKSLHEMSGVIKKEFKDFRVGVFHGKMTPQEKTTVVKNFRNNKIQVLIATTVIEVGLNVENATLMVVENPEHFGLAQLHQLRGRIRRSAHQPYFILISSDRVSDNAKKRIKAIAALTDGFKIAEEDLKLRGPGDFFGNLQHGLPDLKIADPLKDLEILKAARAFAYQTVKSDPHLDRPVHRCIREYLFS